MASQVDPRSSPHAHRNHISCISPSRTCLSASSPCPSPCALDTKFVLALNFTASASINRRGSPESPNPPEYTGAQPCSRWLAGHNVRRFNPITKLQVQARRIVTARNDLNDSEHRQVATATAMTTHATSTSVSAATARSGQQHPHFQAWVDARRR